MDMEPVDMEDQVYFTTLYKGLGLPWWLSGKEPAY